MVKEGGEQHLDQSDMAGLACTSGAEVLRRLLRTVPVFSVEAAGEDLVGNVLPLRVQEAPGPVASSAAGGHELMNECFEPVRGRSRWPGVGWVRGAGRGCGTTDSADAIFTLSHLFANAGPLPPPFGECGIDPTIDELDCSSFAPCEEGQ